MSKDGAERRFKEADAENKRLQGKLSEREEQLSALCKGLQSARAVGKPPKECLGIK